MTDQILDSGSLQGFSEYPLLEHRDDYAAARAYLVQHSAKIPGLLGLYEYGSVGAPGISDIDLIAVISSEIDPKEALSFLNGTDAPVYVKRVLDKGSIKPVSLTQFQRINILGAISTRPIYAPDPIVPTMPSPAAESFIDIANVFDWLPERVLMLRSLLNLSAIPARRVLGGLGSFKHSVSTSNVVIGQDSPESREFIDSYNELRDHWFTRSEAENFELTVGLILSGIKLGESLLLQVTDQLVEKAILRPCEDISGSTFWLNSTKAFVFDDGQAQSSNGADAIKCSVPTAWIRIPQAYAKCDGTVSKLISHNLQITGGDVSFEIHREFDDILSHRIEWINDSFAFLQPLGLEGLMYRFSHLRPASN